MTGKPSHIDKKWANRGIKAWSAIGIIILIAFAVVACGFIWNAVFTVIIAALIVFLLHGAVNKLEHKGIPRIWGTTISFVGFIAIIVGILWTFIPMTVEQIAAFAKAFPHYAQTVADWGKTLIGTGDGTILTNEQFNDLVTQGTQFLTSTDTLKSISDFAGTFTTNIFSSVSAAGNVALSFGIGLIVAFWVLIDLPKMAQEIRVIAGENRQTDIDIISNAFGTAIYGWLKATLACAILTGVASGILFAIFGVPYPLLLGFICGLFYIVPYIGPMVSFVICAIIGLFVSPFTCLMAILVNIIVTNIVANLVSPKMMKNSVNVHPAITLIVILIGQACGGIIGMLLAIPLAAAIQTICIAYFEAKTGRRLYASDGAFFNDPNAPARNVTVQASEDTSSKDNEELPTAAEEQTTAEQETR